MKKLFIFVTASLITLTPLAQAQTLDELARMVREAANSEAQINQEREAQFLKDRNNQRNLLGQARQDLANENARSDRLRVEYDPERAGAGRTRNHPGGTHG